MTERGIPGEGTSRPGLWSTSLVGVLAIAACAVPGGSTLDKSTEAPLSDPMPSEASTATDSSTALEHSDGTDGVPTAPTCLRPLAESPPAVAKPANDCPPDPAPGTRLPEVEIVFVDAPGQPRVLAEHAVTQAQKSRGLMYRTQLGEDAGMLFSWPDEAPRSFWMKNTCLPLDMMFIDSNGFIVSALEQVPTMNEIARQSICWASRVLEVNAGWIRAHAVEPGQRVEIRE